MMCDTVVSRLEKKKYGMVDETDENFEPRRKEVLVLDELALQYRLHTPVLSARY